MKNKLTKIGLFVLIIMLLISTMTGTSAESGTDSSEEDTDGDGMDDFWEEGYGLNSSDPNDADEDPDGDGYTNYEEYLEYTDPQDSSSYPMVGDDDSDGDGMDDYWEDDNGLNSSDPNDADEDPDGDGYNNHEEFMAYSDPQDPSSVPSTDDDDSDGDGMDDEWEDANGLNSSDPNDADEDPDNDGYTNYDEYWALSDPQDASSNPETDDKYTDDDGVDPSTETPTDTGITVTITSARFSVTEKGNNVVVDVLVKGTTSGVDHCWILTVDQYNDGTKDKEFYWDEDEFDNIEDPETSAFFKNLGVTAYHFKPTSDNWKTWEYKLSGTVSKEEWEGDDADENKTVTKTTVYVRAFSDEEGTKWNQASKEVSVKSGSDKDDDDDGGLPGFKISFALLSFGLAMIIVSFLPRRR